MSAAPTLPTFSTLGVAPPTNVDANQVAQAWVTAFGQAVSARDLDGILSLLHEEPWWRDLWALTWDLRSFRGKDKIRQFLSDRLPVTRQAVAKHLTVLERAGLVTATTAGRERRYGVDEERFARAVDQITSVGAAWDARLRRIKHIAEAIQRAADEK